MTPWGKLILVITLASKAMAVEKLHVRSPSDKPTSPIFSKFYLSDILDLKRLAASDIKLAKQLDELVRSTKTKLTARTKLNLSSEATALVLRYLQDFKDANGVEAVDSLELNEVIENPISVYRLMRRWHLIVKNISQMINEKEKYMEIEQPSPDLIPEELDLEKAVNTILVIQLMYNFNVTQFADGNILGLVMKPRLRGVHCAEIGARALEREMYVAAVEWFKEAGRLAKTDGTISIDAANEKIAESIKAHDRAWGEENRRGTFGGGNFNFYVDPLKLVPAEDNTKVRDLLYNKTKASNLNLGDVLVNSWGLCAGENLQNPAVKSHLFCWHEFQIHPVYRLGPLNMEFLNRDPDIVQIYNALFKTDMIRMRESPTVQLATSKLFQRHLPRTLSLEITTKFERMVGLNASGSSGMNEPMTIMSLAPGRGPDEGHGSADTWTYHVDTATTGNYEDHFATVLAYLYPVKQGGYTAFSLLLTAAEPISGSAIFYFNVLADGNLDDRTLHFGCPVAVGQKWIVLHRIPLHDQLVKKLCPLEPKERYQFPVNGQTLPIPEELRQRTTGEVNPYIKTHSLMRNHVPVAQSKHHYGRNLRD